MGITTEDIQKYIELGGSIDLLTPYELNKVPRSIINQYVANGRDIDSLTYYYKEAIPQEFINQYVANGGDLRPLTSNQMAAIPREIIYQYVANGGDRLTVFSKAYIKSIPQSIIDQYVANGGDLFYLTDSQKEAISQESINQYVANGGDLQYLTKAQIAAISQENVNKLFADGVFISIYGFTKDQHFFIPYQIKSLTEKAREAIILYAAGKITSSELPADVYANYDARKKLLEIIKHKTMKEFVEKCERAGYDKDTVPAELIQAFNARLAGIEQEIKAKIIEAVKELSKPAEQKRKAEEQRQKDEMQRQKGEGQKQKAKIQNLKKDIMVMEW